MYATLVDINGMVLRSSFHHTLQGAIECADNNYGVIAIELIGEGIMIELIGEGIVWRRGDQLPVQTGASVGLSGNATK